MPDYIIIGSSTVGVEQLEASVDIDSLGVAAATLSFDCPYVSAVAYALTKVAHPDFPWLTRMSARVSRLPAERGRVVVNFKGISPEYAATTQRVYAVEGATSSEPIESHANFTAFAGTKASPLNGAMFINDSDDSEDGKFLGFSADNQPTDPNRRKTGTRSYLAPSLVLTETIVRPYSRTSGYSPQRASSMVGLGTIDEPPANGLVPTVYATRNYLLSSITVEDLGNGTREVRRWRLSGPRGWDVDIYRRNVINK